MLTKKSKLSSLFAIEKKFGVLRSVDKDIYVNGWIVLVYYLE